MVTRPRHLAVTAFSPLRSRVVSVQSTCHEFWLVGRTSIDLDRDNLILSAYVGTRFFGRTVERVDSSKSGIALGDISVDLIDSFSLEPSVRRDQAQIGNEGSD